ncbi:MAG: UDP-N-acetylmuramoyl-L-alanyl-D-glutamate--2,6-diaminopimelate ligase [bacterium]|nr:UDP-N-acetylmuramoyl-L-alanyl-D-glutamate--2,6-diaminopimelate ligase [bacterium]
MELFKMRPKDYMIYGNNKEISQISNDTRNIKPNSLYFCIKGENFNGEELASEAVKKGSVAIVSENKLNLDKSVTQIIVPCARSAMSEMANKFYGDPAKDMLKIAVTGTNGKTTTTMLLNNALTKAGFKVGVIGTNGTLINNKSVKSNLTTPDPIEFFSLLAKMKEEGVNCVCFEASAHALSLHKLDGIKSDIAILTNISQDHLDYFKTMENYANAKAKLFSNKMTSIGIINTDSPLANEIADNCNVPVIRLSADHGNVFIEDFKQTNSGISFVSNIYGKKDRYNMKLNGHFNALNALNVLVIGQILEINKNVVKTALSEVKEIPGRFNRIVKNGVNFIVDFAHTPEAILNSLNASRELADNCGGKLICVFGCGGNRDATKRSIMGKIACDNADKVIITSDNPRNEDPMEIINNIKSGITEYTNYVIEPNRAKAIKLAYDQANANDVIAVLGKGCENYFEVKGEKLPYSDSEEIGKI